MSTPAIPMQTVADIDITPACEAQRHGENRPRADYWINLHNCMEAYTCAPCLAEDRRVFARLAPFGCNRCGQQFQTFEQAYTRVVLLP